MHVCYHLCMYVIITARMKMKTSTPAIRTHKVLEGMWRRLLDYLTTGVNHMQRCPANYRVRGPKKPKVGK